MHIGIPSGSWESKASDSEKIWPMLQCNPFPRSYETAPETMVAFNCPAHHGIDLKKNQHQVHRAKGLSQQKHI